MSIGDMKAWILCDRCEAEDEVSFPFTYGGIMHTDGRYDHKRPILPKGWVEVGNGQHHCEDCVASDERGDD